MMTRTRPVSWLLALVLSAARLAAQTPQEGAQAFQTHCAACHVVDQSIVGPSLVEISGLYRDKPADFVQWCLKPGRKRQDRIEMPSMAHVGEPALKAIHAYILEAAKGKTEKAVSNADPYAKTGANLPRPSIQRIFLPEASPAAIAVALPGTLSFCFDAAECRLRYVWDGGFIQGYEHWKGNGSALAAIDGTIRYRESRHPFDLGSGDPKPKFLGYSVKNGLPTFHYLRHGLRIEETIEPSPDGKGILRSFKTDGSRPISLEVDPSVTVEPSSRTIPAASAKAFQLIFRWP